MLNNWNKWNWSVVYSLHTYPSAVILILGIVSLSARVSQGISVIISRGIIHVICLLLLLSYTSVASTLLILLRSLIFHEINKVYTYLSPGVEYCHDHHLRYSIVATIPLLHIFPLYVIDIPLLRLSLFFNCRFNFVMMKSLLDQFQGYYIVKYHCFCWLVIIAIVINSWC